VLQVFLLGAVAQIVGARPHPEEPR